MASILTTLFYMALILAVISLILPARFYEARRRSRKRSFLIWLGLALVFFIGISFFAPSVPFQPRKAAPESSQPAIPAPEAPVPETPEPETPAPVPVPEAAPPEPAAPAPAAPTPTRIPGVTQQDLIDETEEKAEESGTVRGIIEMPAEGENSASPK